MGMEGKIMKAARNAALALAAIVVWLGAAPILAAEDAKPLTVQLSNDASILVVADPVSHTMAVYRIVSNDLQVIARRDLTKDMSIDSGQGTAAAGTTPLPTKDAPGQDPPDFRRPGGALRLNTAHSSDKFGESWSVDYLVPGTVADTYETLRRGAKDWRVASEHFYAPSLGELQLVRGEVEITVRVFEARPEGWVRLQVQETRRKT